MKIRFQADADFNNSAIVGIARRWPLIDIRSAQGLIADGVPDSEILAVSAAHERVLLTHDVSTMPRHFSEFLAHSESPGIIFVPQHRPISSIMGGVFLVWSYWTPEEIRNSMRWLPG